jgi:hypothetical protein
MALSDTAKHFVSFAYLGVFYQYNVLHQGIKLATDIFQQRMGTMFHDMSIVDILWMISLCLDMQISKPILLM